MPDVRRDRFQPVPEAAAAVRSFVRQAVDGLEVPVDDVVIAAHELAANAIRHAHTLFDVVVERDDDSVRVAVLDRDPTIPIPAPPTHDATSGRGLHLVARTADEWGVRPAPPGKAVWFRCRAHGRTVPEATAVGLAS